MELLEEDIKSKYNISKDGINKALQNFNKANNLNLMYNIESINRVCESQKGILEWFKYEKVNNVVSGNRLKLLLETLNSKINNNKDYSNEYYDTYVIIQKILNKN